MADGAAAVDDEGAALDTDVLVAVHILFFEHAVGVAQGFVGVGQQRERECVFAAEVVVLFHRVARYPDNGGADVGEGGVMVAKILAFLGTARRVVTRVEIQYQRLVGEIGQAQRAAAAGGGAEGRGLIVDVDSHVFTGSSRPSACSSSHRSMKLSRSSCGCCDNGTCS